VRAKRIPLNVSADRKEMLVVGDGKGLEPALVKGAGAQGMMGMMPSHRMRHRQPVHEHRKIPIGLRPEHQVPMIRHQAKRQQPHRHGFNARREQLLERGIVGGGLENGRSAHGPVQHMADDAGSVHAFRSWHGRHITAPANACKRNSLPSPFLPFLPRNEVPWQTIAIAVPSVALAVLAMSLFHSGRSGWGWLTLAMCGGAIFALLRGLNEFRKRMPSSSSDNCSSGGYGGVVGVWRLVAHLYPLRADCRERQ
jgi:hypothetical protein